MKDWFKRQTGPVKGFLVGLLVIVILAATSSMLKAEEWTLDQLNNHIDETNFIVGNHCSATLVNVSEASMLLTNNHCIDQYVKSEEREIISEDGEIIKKKFVKTLDVPVSQRKYDGHQVVSVASYNTTIKAYDEEFDLALLQFYSKKIPNTVVSTLYTGEQIQRGVEVYAVGNPLLLDAALTKGIISSTNRRIQIGKEEKDFFQMDAGIAGGSSGGSLYTLDGKLVGVPAAAAKGTMVGLAIPYTSIMEFLEENCYTTDFVAIEKCGEEDKE